MAISFSAGDKDYISKLNNLAESAGDVQAASNRAETAASKAENALKNAQAVAETGLPDQPSNPGAFLMTSGDATEWGTIRFPVINNSLCTIIDYDDMFPKVKGDPVFTRPCVASYIDSLGFLKDAAIDEPRREIDGWLIEGYSENHILFSEQQDDNYWVKQNIDIESGIEDPRGGNNAFKIRTWASGPTRMALRPGTIPLSGSAGDEYTFSVFLKAAEWTKASLFYDSDKTQTNSYFGSNAVIDLETGELSGQSTVIEKMEVQKLRDGWLRVSLNMTFKEDYVSGDVKPTIVPRNNEGSVNDIVGDGTSGIYVFGPQIEKGVGMTSYIKTTNSIAARYNDELSVAVKDNLPNLNDRGSLVARIKNFKFGSAYPALLSMNGSTVGISLNVAEQRRLYTQVRDINGTSNYMGLSDTYSAFTLDNFELALTWDNRKFSSYYNQRFVSNVVLNTRASEPEPTYQILINQNGRIRSAHYSLAAVYPEALTPAEVSYLTRF